MDIARRLLLLGIGAGMAGCVKRGAEPPPLVLDTSLLDHAFPELAARARPGFLNAGVQVPATNQAWCWDKVTRMPLQSVFKAPLASAALAEVDAGRMTLNERIRLTADDLSPLHSRIDAAWPTPPEGHIMDMPAIDLIALAVQESDNTAADTVMKRIGGPAAVTAWLRAKGVEGISIDRYERDLQQDLAGLPMFRPEWKDEVAWLAARDEVPTETRERAMNAYLADARDTATVPAALDWLNRLASGQLLSPASTRLLLRLMTDTATGSHRIRAGVPSSASLAHKTGSAATDLGRTPAANDIGLVTLADGRRFAAAVFLAGSTATEAERDRLIADTARLFVRALGDPRPASPSTVKPL
jgi:beta-lactamase class A